MRTFQNLDQLLKKFADQSVAGCGCCVTQDQQIVYEGYYGYASVETHKPVAYDTVFRLASMTKIAIYVACMMLYEKGAFLLDEPLYHYFPAYRSLNKYVGAADGSWQVQPIQEPIRIKHVMSMTCGLPYGNLVPGLDESKLSPTQRDMISVERKLRENGSFTLQQEVEAMASVPLAFEPGTHWLYGFGSELAAALVERLTGMSIESALEDMLFKPLGMHDTGMHFFGNIRDRLCTLYERKEDGKLIPADPLFDEKHLPGKEHEFGCPRLFSTVRDFSVLGTMLANGGIYRENQIIGRKTIDLMRENQLSEQQLKDFRSDYLNGYGYGLGVRTMMNPALGNANVTRGEFGWTGGFGTWLSVDPQERVSVVYMHQMAPNMEYEHHLRVRAAVYGAL